MNYKISKELFESVMDYDKYTKVYVVDDVVAWQTMNSSSFTKINDFFFKCFDWAYKKGYTLSFCTNDLSRLLRYSCLAEPMDDSSDYKEILSHNAHQTVIDACQWILDNKAKK